MGTWPPRAQLARRPQRPRLTRASAGLSLPPARVRVPRRASQREQIQFQREQIARQRAALEQQQAEAIAGVVGEAAAGAWLRVAPATQTSQLHPMRARSARAGPRRARALGGRMRLVAARVRR